MILTLKFIHIAFAAAWFGHKLLVPADLRASTTTRERAEELVPRLKRAERLGQISGAGTLLAGAFLTTAVGFDTVEIGVHVGMALVVAAIAMGAIFARPASKRLFESIDSGDLDGATRAASRITLVLGAEHLLWAGALLAMLV